MQVLTDHPNLAPGQHILGRREFTETFRGGAEPLLKARQIRARQLGFERRGPLTVEPCAGRGSDEYLGRLIAGRCAERFHYAAARRMARRRRINAPVPPKPMIIIAQVIGSGTAAMSVTPPIRI